MCFSYVVTSIGAASMGSEVSSQEKSTWGPGEERSSRRDASPSHHLPWARPHSDHGSEPRGCWRRMALVSLSVTLLQEWWAENRKVLKRLPCSCPECSFPQHVGCCMFLRNLGGEDEAFPTSPLLSLSGCEGSVTALKRPAPGSPALSPVGALQGQKGWEGLSAATRRLSGLEEPGPSFSVTS